MKHLLLSLLAVCCLAACSEDDNRPSSKNYIRLTTESATTLTEDSKDTLAVTVTLGNTLEQPATVHFMLEGNEGDILTAEPMSLEFAKGEKVKALKVYSNGKSALKDPRIITLRVKGASDENMVAWGDGIALTVNPDSDLPVLTEEQQQLLKGYRDQLGMDVERMIGKLSCRVKVLFPKDEVGEEGETVFSKTEVQEFTTSTIVTLSEKATADKVVLKMQGNALGLTSVFHGILNKELDIEMLQGPYYRSVSEAIQLNLQQERFSMALDQIEVGTDGKVQFVGKVQDTYGDWIGGIPFEYNFSAWDRQRQMAADGALVDVVVKDEEGNVVEELPETPMKSLIEDYGVSFNPTKYMVSSDITEDSWSTGIWKAPQSQVNFAEGTWTFSFPWDHVYSSDWTLVEVTYSLHPAE